METRRWRREQEAKSLIDQAERVDLMTAQTEEHRSALNDLSRRMRTDARHLFEPEHQSDVLVGSRDVNTPPWILAAMEAEPA